MARYDREGCNRTYNNWDVVEQQVGGGSGGSYTKAEVDAKLAVKQDTLTAGNNIILNGTIINANQIDDSATDTTKTYSAKKILELVSGSTGDVTKAYVDAADTALDTKISTEVTNRANADTTLTNNLNAEVKTRTDADTELLGKININKGNIEIVNNSVTVLQNKVDTHITEYEENLRKVQTQITNEATTRGTKDSELEAKIAALEADIKVEVVDSMPTAPVNNTMYFIKQADGTYARKLYNNNTWYDMGDTQVDLSNYYTKAETYSQSQIDDKVTFINNEITTEKTTRANADTTLLNNINTEVTSRTAADTTLQENIDKKQNKLTADDGIKIENDTISVDLTTIVDKLYPIGYVVVASQAPGLGTWADITDSYSNRYLRLGAYGELTEEALPIPDMTIAEAGEHTHTLKAGSVGAAMHSITGTGAYSVTSASYTTSSSGAHTHTLTATAGGVYQEGAAVQPLGFGIRIFQRTA